MAVVEWTGKISGSVADGNNYVGGTAPADGDDILGSYKSNRAMDTHMGFLRGDAATETLTLVANVGNTETVTLGESVYTFQTTLTDADGNVLIGGSASASLDNLIAAITRTGTSGTDYAASTVLHPTCTAVAGVGDTMDVTALIGGTAGNAIVSTDGLVDVGNIWGGATLSGGADNWTMALIFWGPDCIVDIGTQTDPLYGTTFTKVVHKGSGSVHIRATTLTEVICNSDQPQTVAAMTIGTTTTLTKLLCVKGFVTVSPSVGTLTRVLVSFRDSKFSDVKLDIGESSSAIAEFRMVGGVVVTNRLPTLFFQEQGDCTILDTAPAATVTLIEVNGGYLAYNSSNTIARANIFAGTLDVNNVTNALTITDIAVWPNATFLRSDDVVTYGGSNVLVDLTGGDV